jgi:hypothetical protein
LNTTVPTNGFYASGSGSIFQNCPLTYGRTECLNGTATTYSQFYLKGTAIHDSSIAEYVSTIDCNLNAGAGGSQVGSFNDNKVCLFVSAITGSNAGGGTWAQATDFVIGPGDTGGYKVNTELDITNNGADCAVGVRNCYALIIAENGANPITSYISVTTSYPATGSQYSAHFGILVNGAKVADPVAGVDIENSGGAAIGICNGCLVPQTHAQAGFEDRSTTPIGLLLSGTYSTSAIRANLPASAGTGGQYVCADANGTFYRKASCP